MWFMFSPWFDFVDGTGGDGSISRHRSSSRASTARRFRAFRKTFDFT
jgi:hypothetical protein